MAFLAKIFGTGKKGEAPTPHDAIQKLRETEELLIKKTDFLEKKMEIEIATAKKHGIKNKRLALQALKRKKMYEKQLNQVDGTLSTLEFQRTALENATSNTEVLTTMGAAAKALQAAHKQMDVDKIQDLMDDIAEQAQIGDEIANAISTPSNFGYAYDDDELLAELEELEQEEFEDEVIGLPSPPVVVPVAPQRAKKSKQSEKSSNEFAELEAWAAS